MLLDDNSAKDRENRHRRHPFRGTNAAHTGISGKEDCDTSTVEMLYVDSHMQNVFRAALPEVQKSSKALRGPAKRPKSGRKLLSAHKTASIQTRARELQTRADLCQIYGHVVLTSY